MDAGAAGWMPGLNELVCACCSANDMINAPVNATPEKDPTQLRFTIFILEPDERRKISRQSLSY